MTETAYSTDNPETVAAHRAALAAYNAWGERLKDDVNALDAGPNVWLTGARGEREIEGIEAKPLPDDQGYHIPDGWQINKDGVLKPRRGKPGQVARDWIADHKMPNIRAAMDDHGLPREVWVPNGFRYRIVGPDLFEHDGTLWAKYPLAPDKCGFNPTECTWTPRKLSEFYAAKEAVEAAAETEKADA